MNSIGLYNALSNTNTALAKNNDQIANLNNIERINNVSQDKKSAVGAGESLVLSSRSQKLNALSNEFFSKENFTQIDTSKFVERVHEYGLMTGIEYEQLTSSSLYQSVKDYNIEEEYTLVDHLENIDVKVDGSPEADTISIGVNKAITVLSDVEAAKLSPTFKQDVNIAITQLSYLSDSELYGVLDSKEQQTIQSSATALSLIDRLSPQRISNPYVNRYLDFAQ